MASCCRMDRWDRLELHPMASSTALQTSREQAEQLLKHGEALLNEWKYPDPQLREYHVALMTLACVKISPYFCCPAALAESLKICASCCCYSAPAGYLPPALFSCAAPYYPGGNMFSRNPPMPKEVSSSAVQQHWPAAVMPRMHAGACMALQQQRSHQQAAVPLTRSSKALGNHARNASTTIPLLPAPLPR